MPTQSGSRATYRPGQLYLKPDGTLTILLQHIPDLRLAPLRGKEAGTVTR